MRVKCEGLKRGKLENSVARNHERTIAEVESVCGELLIEEFSSQFGEQLQQTESDWKDQNGSFIAVDKKAQAEDSFSVRR